VDEHRAFQFLLDFVQRTAAQDGTPHP
jgi:hypothetical protein